MKYKKSLYWLVPLVLGLWGLIGYRVWDAVAPQEETLQPIAFAALPSVIEDTATLYVPQLNYPDPFLKGVRFTQTRASRPRAVSPAAANPAPSPAPVPEPPKPWPIQYHGYVLQGGQPDVAMLTIDSTFASLTVGQSLHGFQLKALRTDSVEIMHRQDTRWFPKE